MTWSTQILLFAYASSGTVVLMAARRWRRQGLLLVLNVALIALTALCQATLGATVAAWVGGTGMVLQMVWVRLGLMAIQAAMKRGRYPLAARLNSLVSPLLGPSRRAPSVMFEVYGLLESGDLAGAIQRLHAEGLDSPTGRYCRTLAYRLEDDAAGMCLWLEEGRMSGWTREDPGYLVAYLGCVGEVYGAETALARWAELEAEIRRDGGRRQVDRARLLLLAQCGDVDRLATLTDAGALDALPPAERALRLATALQAAGAPDRAATLLDAEPLDDPFAEIFFRQRRIRPLPPLPRPLADELEARLASFYCASWLESAYRGIGGRLSRSHATLLLLVLSAAMAGACARLGGVTDGWTLYHLGSLSIAPDSALGLLARIPASIEGQGWRLFTANLLHYGWPHLIANCLGLAIFGPFTERFLGTWRMGVVYLAAGVGGMGTVLLAVNIGLLPPMAIVGASAALMGAVGAGLVITGRGWFVTRSRSAARLALWFAGLIAMQTVLDMFTPQTSFTAHAAGLAIGAVVAFVLHRVPQPPPVAGGARVTLRETSISPIEGA